MDPAAPNQPIPTPGAMPAPGQTIMSAQQVVQAQYAPHPQTSAAEQPQVPHYTTPAMPPQPGVTNNPNYGYMPTAAPGAPAGAPGVVTGAAGQPAGPAVRPATNPNSTQNSLMIAEIRDGIVIMNDGSFRSVVMVKSVNFDLMSPQEQEAVEYSYQGFLNSLYFPIQIFIRSQKVDLQPYIAKLDKIRSEHENMLLVMLMEDYINYIGQLSQQTNIMDKKFYIVVPYFPHTEVQKALTQSKNFLSGFISLFNTRENHVVVNEADLEKAKTELRNRVQSVLQGLLQAGVQGLPLDTQELIELYYDTYNPDTATRQQLKNFGNLTADIVTKGQGTALQQHLKRELN